MSFWNIIKAIPGAVAKVAAKAFSIVKVAEPILRALRPAIDEVDEAFVYVQARIEEGGVIADDFLDANIETIRATGKAFEKVSAMGSVGYEVCKMLDDFSQVETPDTITEEEFVAVAEKIDELRDILNDSRGVFDAAIVKLGEME